MLGTLLLVDDDESARKLIVDFLGRSQVEVREADSLASARTVCANWRPDAAIFDFSLPDGNGLQVMAHLLAIDPTLPTIVLTGHASIDLAVEAVKAGAEHFLTKPVDLPALRMLVTRALEKRDAARRDEVTRFRAQKGALNPFLGTSRLIRTLEETATRVAPASAPLLIQGETGTGKGVLASWIHRMSPRRAAPFVDLNCAGLVRELLESELFGHEKGAFTGANEAKGGLLDAAHGGTLFLDEIGDMSLEIQPRLLKVVEEQRFRRVGGVKERHVNVRLVTATHHDLVSRVGAGLFRQDLLYRIEAIRLHIPPLRARGDDVILLARAIAARLGEEMGRQFRLAGSAEGPLSAHSWPGNIRELRNVIERAALMCDGDELGADDVSAALVVPGRTVPVARTLGEIEREAIRTRLESMGGDVRQTATSLGLSRSALYQRLRREGIPIPGDSSETRRPRGLGSAE